MSCRYIHTWLLLLVLLVYGDHLRAQYVKYKKKGDNAVDNHKFPDALKQYEAAKYCDNLTDKEKIEIDSLIAITYGKWNKELQEMMKASVRLSMHDADQFAKQGDFTSANNALHEKKRLAGDVPELTQLISELQAYLPDQMEKNTFSSLAYTYNNKNYLALLKHIPHKEKSKKALPDDEEETVSFSPELHILETGNKTIKKIAIDTLDVESLEPTIKKINDQLLIITDKKIVFFDLRLNKILKGSDWIYRLRASGNFARASSIESNFYGRLPTLVTYLFSMGILFKMDPPVNPSTARLFDLRMFDQKTGKEVLSVSRIYTMFKTPDPSTFCLVRLGDSLRQYDILFLDLIKKIIYDSVKQASSYPTFLSEGRYISFYKQKQIIPSQDSSNRFISERYLYDYGEKRMLNDEYKRFPTLTSTTAVTKIKNGYIVVNSDNTKLSICDSLFREIRAFQNYTYSCYHAATNRLAFVSKNVSTGSGVTKNIIATYDLNSKDSTFYSPPASAEVLGNNDDSLMIIQKNDEAQVVNIFNNPNQPLLTLKNKRIKQIDTLGKKFLDIYFTDTMENSPIEERLFYSIQDKKVLLQTDFFTGTSDPSYSLINYPGRNRKPVLYYYDKETEKIDDYELDVPREELQNKKATIYFNADKKLLIVITNGAYIDYTSNNVTEVSSKKWEVSILKIYDIINKTTRTIKAGVQAEFDAVEMFAGNYLVFSGKPPVDDSGYEAPDKKDSTYLFNLNNGFKKTVPVMSRMPTPLMIKK